MLLLIGGVLIVAIAALGAAGRLPKNYFAGIRIPSTMRSDAAWTAGHRAAAPALAGLGLSFIGLGLWDMSSIGASAPSAAPLLIVSVVFGTWATVAAHKAARDVAGGVADG